MEDKADLNNVALFKKFGTSALGVIVLVAVLLLTPLPVLGRLSTAIGDLVHAPMFAVLAFLTLWSWQAITPRTRWTGLIARTIVVWAVLSMFGLGMEFLQDRFGRSFSRHDVIANSLGCITAGLVHLAGAALAESKKRLGYVLLCAALTVLGTAF